MSVETEIDNYIKQRGGSYSDWYAGIATKPRERLFTDHNVSEQSGAWIYRDAGSEREARRIEEVFHRKGCKGDTGGGDRPQHVYAYKITSATRE